MTDHLPHCDLTTRGGYCDCTPPWPELPAVEEIKPVRPSIFVRWSKKIISALWPLTLSVAVLVGWVWTFGEWVRI